MSLPLEGIKIIDFTGCRPDLRAAVIGLVRS
jgi:hypothetical protein